MSEKRFTIHELCKYDEEQEKWVDCDRHCITDNERHINYDLLFDYVNLCKLLNEQQSIIDKLDQENADLLGARIKAQEEWEKCTDKLKEKILKQQATIKSKDKQLERLYNYFQYYLKDEMSGNAFSEMWDIVKEDESLVI